MVGFIDYYEVLGIAQDATQEQIVRAYRTRIREVHPDRNPGAVAEAAARRVIEARDVLQDPARRRVFDEQRRARRVGRAPHRSSSSAPWEKFWRETEARNREFERRAAEARARAEAERRAWEARARAETERWAEEARARAEAMRVEAERQAWEARARAEAMRAEAERRVWEARARAEAEMRAAEARARAASGRHGRQGTNLPPSPAELLVGGAALLGLGLIALLCDSSPDDNV